MLVVGAKGLAKEVLMMLSLNNDVDNLAFFDDINLNEPNLLFNKYPILRREDQAKTYFKQKDNRFTLGVGNPIVRYNLYQKFIKFGADPFTLISSNSDVGFEEMNIKEAVTISYHCAISNSVEIGKGSFVNVKTVIGHDSKIGDFVEICPSVNIGGHCQIGDFTFIGTGAIIYPKVKIGKNVSITAGSVIRKNIPDNVIVHGNPSKIIGKKSDFKPI